MTLRLLAVVLAGLASPRAADAAALCVNTAGSGGCFATVQQAVDAAARDAVIAVAAGVYVEHVVVPPGARLAIAGAGPGSTVLDGGGSGTVFEVQVPNSNVSLTGATIRNGERGIAVGERGKLTLADCEVTANAGLGGIRMGDRSTVKMTGCAVTGNSNVDPGGGIAAPGFPGGSRLTIVSSTIDGNTSSGSGGGILSNGTVKLLDSTVSGNLASGSGGGIFADNLRAEGSTISGNSTSYRGGGISGQPAQFGRGTVKLTDSTISGNSAGEGGGIWVVHGMTFDHVTIADNSADLGGAMASQALLHERITIKSSVIAGNQTTSFSDCRVEQIRARNGILVDDPTCPVLASGSSPVVIADPLLGPLQDNGGPTETHALGAGSPAIAVVTSAAGCRSPDQRGVPRVRPCDLGAYEAP